MNPAVFAIRRSALVYVVVGLLVVLGIDSVFRLGWLEDPEFSIKTATIVTAWPGAGPEEVEQQITEHIERAVQNVAELDFVRSVSRAGMSVVFVEIDDRYRSDDLPQIWDEVRRHVNDVRALLPDGSAPPQVNDDYGHVYGILLAVSGDDGIPYKTLSEHVEDLQRDLLGVEGVARAEVWGARQETVEITVSRPRLAALGVSIDDVLRAVSTRNSVTPAGAVESGRARFRLAPSGVFDTLDTIGGTVVARRDGGALIHLRDVADIRRAFQDPPSRMMRFNGRDAMAIGLSPVPGANVVRVGDAVKTRLAALDSFRPAGIEVGVVSYQPDIVEDAVNTFILSLGLAVTIVLAVVWAFMGARGGAIVGVGLVLTILATLVVMRIVGIDLQRMSVGAMIVALGILVDNAIVVTDYILVLMRTGVDRMTAARRAVADLAWPLAGATVVAVAAFLPIFLSPDVTGEYVATLFLVIAIALSLSWAVAVTVTPLLCHRLLKTPNAGTPADPFAGPVFTTYRAVLRVALAHRSMALLLMAAAIGGAGYGFTFVSQNFFPTSDRAAVMLDYWLPQDGRTADVSEDLRIAEQHFLAQEGVRSVATFIGGGPPRFQTSLNPEIPRAVYGQLIINLESAERVPAMVAHGDQWLLETFPQAEPRMRVFPLATTEAFKIEARFSGPDPHVLMGLADQAMAILAAEPGAKSVRHDWRQQVRTVTPVLAEERARRADITRQDVAAALLRVTDGVPIGIFREGDDRLPIVWRVPEAERHDVAALPDISVRSMAATSGVPMAQVVSDMALGWEWPLIWRRDRQRTVTVQADPQGMEAYELQARVQDAIEAISLPPGYRFEWGGEYEASVDGQANVNAKVPIGMILTLIVLVALFNGLRQPLIIFLTVPLCIVGVTVGLLLTGAPFGFMALLGVLSLQGMLIKNGIVLVDQVEANMRAGLDRFEAVIEGAVSRLVSITVGALTTALGLIPLLFDTFFKAMAVAIMGGLLFGTVLTLIVLPIFYTIAFRIGPAPQDDTQAGDALFDTGKV